MLECTAERGDVYDWYKDGKAYELSCTRGLLEIDSVKSSDSGVYHCVAVNRGGKVTSQRAKITVGRCGFMYVCLLICQRITDTTVQRVCVCVSLFVCFREWYYH